MTFAEPSGLCAGKFKLENRGNSSILKLKDLCGCTNKVIASPNFQCGKMPDKVRGNPLTGFYGSLSVNSRGGAKHDMVFDRNLGCCINCLLVCGGDCDGTLFLFNDAEKLQPEWYQYCASSFKDLEV